MFKGRGRLGLVLLKLYLFLFVHLRWMSLRSAFVLGELGKCILDLFCSQVAISSFRHKCFCRGTETEEQVLKRLRNAEAEIEQGKSLGIFDHILYNDNLEECYKSLKVSICCFLHSVNSCFCYP